MTLLVVGSRSISDYRIVRTRLNEYLKDKSIINMISGGALGVDSLARKYAIDNQILFEEILPDWSIGKHAGFVRNEIMFKKCDVCIGFWDGISNGTKHNIVLAKKYNKPIYMFNLLTNIMTLYYNNTEKSISMS